MSKKKLLIIIAVIVLVGILIVLKINGSKAKNNQIETAKTTIGNIKETISSSGKTKAEKAVDLHFQTGGKLNWVGVKEGDSVYLGQAIASLDQQQLQKDLDKSMRDYLKERNDFEQDKNVTYHGMELTDTLQRILQKNQWDLEKAVLDVELKDIALKYATLITPIAGIVSHLDKPVAGVNVLYTDTFSIVDPTSLIFTANVDEVDVGKIALGQIAEVALDAYPDKKFMGKVSKIAFASEITPAGATIFPVEITFDNPQDLRVGLNGDVNIIINEVSDMVSVPSEAIKESGNTKYVIVKDGQNYVKQEVTTGISSDTNTQVNGINPDIDVVTKGFQYLPKSVYNGN